MNTEDITLSLLTNPIYLTGDNKVNSEKTLSTEDVEFYKKRICLLNKKLLKNIIIHDETLKRAHDAFVYNAIQYFQREDTNDILQKEYDGEYKRNSSASIDISLNDVNLTMFDKVDKSKSLDNFVTIKKIKHEKRENMPQKRYVNLKSQDLKKKKIL